MKRAIAARNKPEVLKLTDREIEILALLAQGFTNTEIGEKIKVNIYTVGSRTHRLRGKLGARTNEQAVWKARFVIDQYMDE